MKQLSVPTPACLSPSLRVNPSSPVVRRSIGRLSRQSLISLALSWLSPGGGNLSAPFLRPARRPRSRRHEDDSRRDTYGNDNDDDNDNDNDDDDDGDDDDDDDDEQFLADFYPPARSREELRRLYLAMETQKGSRKDVADRITQGDWRHGLSLYQVAMIDIQHILDRPASLKWSAHRLVLLKPPTTTAADGGGDTVGLRDDSDKDDHDHDALSIPRLHPSTFMHRLQDHILPDTKTHLQFDRPPNGRFTLLRIFIMDSPYNTALALSGPDPAARTVGDLMSAHAMYVAFPDGSPFVYISKGPVVGPVTATSDTRRIRGLVLRAIPKALSGPGCRYALKPTHVASRNIDMLLERRGPDRTNFAGGGWSHYTGARADNSPLGILLPTPPLSDAPSESNGDPVDDANRDRDRHGHVAAESETKRRRIDVTIGRRDDPEESRLRLLAQARFGDSGRMGDGKGLERLDVVMEDPFPLDSGASGGDVPHGVADVTDATRQNGRNSEVAAPWTPGIRMVFQGPHVFAGVRQLVEAGVISGERVPGWLTGEEGVTMGVVRRGRLRGQKKPEKPEKPGSGV